MPARIVLKKRSNKFHARGVRDPEAGWFASQREYKRWGQLQALLAGGVIRDLERQVRYKLEIQGLPITTYIADFRYYDREMARWVIEDAKGVQTEAFKIKKALMLALKGIRVECV